MGGQVVIGKGDVAGPEAQIEPRINMDHLAATGRYAVSFLLLVENGVTQLSGMDATPDPIPPFVIRERGTDAEEDFPLGTRKSRGPGKSVGREFFGPDQRFRMLSQNQVKTVIKGMGFGKVFLLKTREAPPGLSQRHPSKTG